MEKREKRSINANFYMIIMVVCLFCFYFIMQLKFVDDAWFGSDELDVFLLGKAITRGQLLYKDALSQHMPFTYYFSALFYKLGAVSASEQRMAFYAFFAIIWVYIVFNYSKYIDKRILIVYPFIHCCMIQNYINGTAILSEHLAGCGAIILLLEFISFYKRKTISLKNCVAISFSVVLTFGTIFVAIFPLFIIGVGVIALEFRWKNEKKIPLQLWVYQMVRKYFPLIVIGSIPWCILCIYYIYTNTFKDFIFGAYVINRSYYPKYIGDFGSNIISTLFFMPIQMLGAFVTTGITEWNYDIILQWVFVLCAILFITKIYIKDTMLSIIIALYVLSLNVRGMFNFHGTQGTAVFAFAVACVLVECLYKNKNEFKKRRVIEQLGIAAIVIFIGSGYCRNLTKLSDITFEQENETIDSDAMKKLTDKNEPVLQWSMSFTDIMRADRIFTGSASITPWMWEARGEEEFEKIKENPPRVAVYTPEYSCWDYKRCDYAPSVEEFFSENYTFIEGTNTIFVLNSYYEEACEKLNLQVK